MSMKLGEEQQRALDDIMRFIHSDAIAYSLVGYAGTGKSFLINSIVSSFENSRIPYVLTVPTHKAKTVLERFTLREAFTLHKLLSLSPNIEILNLDLKDLKFFSRHQLTLFPIDGIVICDESSMVNDELFELLLEKCEFYNSKIIFVGDKAQLKPVNSFTSSKVFGLEDYFELTKIYRQKTESGLTTVLPTLRKSIINRFQTAEGTEGSLLCHSDTRNFMIEALRAFKTGMKNNDILESKILAYTNSRVGAYNAKIKQILFGEDSEYDKFGLVTAYDNIEFNGDNFWNSMDYIIVDKPLPVQISIPGFIKLPGFKLNLYDSSYKNTKEVHIVSGVVTEDYLNSLAMHIETVRTDAINKKKRNPYGAKLSWQMYYSIVKSFTLSKDLYYDGRLIRKKSFDHGYSTTIHKSQGSSINNVFIDMKNVSICRDPEELRQLQYVSVSRAMTNAHIFQ